MVKVKFPTLHIGKKLCKGKKIDPLKLTVLMKQRDYYSDLELDKNLIKTIVVANPTGRGPACHCETHNRTYRDMRTLEADLACSKFVFALLCFVNSKKEKSNAKGYDLYQRLAETTAKADAEKGREREGKDECCKGYDYGQGG